MPTRSRAIARISMTRRARSRLRPSRSSMQARSARGGYASSRDVMQPIGARVYGALVAVYIIWGSSYLAMRIAIEGFPPLLMAAVRHSCAGGVLFVVLVARGAKLPTLAQWR